MMCQNSRTVEDAADIMMMVKVSGLWETCLDLTEEEWIHLNQRSPWLGNRCYRSHQ